MINFDDPILVDKFGSWVRVQVEFYDFIFQRGSGMCPKHYKDKTLQEQLMGFADGEALYEDTVSAIEKLFKTQKEAWKAFKLEVL